MQTGIGEIVVFEGVNRAFPDISIDDLIGVVGQIGQARFARERDVPYFGICFGMQMAVVEAARNLPASRAPAPPSSVPATNR